MVSPGKRISLGVLGASLWGVLAITQYEGFSEKAYLDIVGVPTIGYGSTDNVKLGNNIDEKGARRRLIQEVRDKYEKAIQSCVKVSLHQREYDSYVSLAYNIGTTAFCSSTLVKKLNQEDYIGACKQILRWNRAKGQVVKGLTNRRQQEYKMCIGEVDAKP